MYSSASLRSIPERSRQTKRRLPINNPEIHRLRVAPHVGRHHQRRHAENFRRRARVDVFARRNASTKTGSCDMCASSRSSICE